MIKQNIIEQGQLIIAREKLETLDDFVNYFQSSSIQGDNLKAEIKSVRSAIPESVWAATAREPWKYWEILTGKPWKDPSPYGH